MSGPRALGRSGLAIAPLVLGGNVFSWTADRAASFAVLDAFVDGGGTMIDTADVYGRSGAERGAGSETMIGEWLKASGKRERVLIASKVGMMPGGLGPARVADAAAASLRRLGTDRIDLYFAHRDDPDTPLEDALGAFDALVRAGKVRAIGASNFTPARLAEALDVSARAGLASFTALQPNYNLMERGFEDALGPLCIARGLGVVPYYALAGGFLTGKYRTAADSAGKARAGMAERYLNPAGLAVLDALDAVAADARATPAQVAIAWLGARPGVTAPIASATSTAQLAELLGAMRLELTVAQRAALDAASGAASGG